jgi:tetratricopeptide (TPR) repeat protein
MTISVPLTELAKLTGDRSLQGLNAQELEAALRGLYGFLPAKATVTIENGLVLIALPPTPPSSEAEADRLAAKAGQRAAKGEHAKAADILRKALELNPAHPSARRDLAMVCQQTGDFEAARDHLIEVLRLNPSDAWALVILANHYLGQENDPDAAEPFLRQALDLKPGDTWALNSMGSAMLARKRPQEALEFFDKAISGSPDFGNAYLGKATVLLETGDSARAASVLEAMFQAAKKQDTRSEPVFRQAQMLYAQTEAALADQKAGAAREAVLALETNAEELSGYPVSEIEEDLEAKVVAKMRMAWKHNADHHTLVLRKEANLPAAVRHHICAHELMHVIMESEARDEGRNRWFSDPDRKHTLASLPGRELTGLQMMCMMYAGFKRFAPELDPGMDLQREYEEAQRMHKGAK